MVRRVSLVFLTVILVFSLCACNFDIASVSSLQSSEKESNSVSDNLSSESYDDNETSTSSSSATTSNTGYANGNSVMSIKGIWIEYTDSVFKDTNKEKFTKEIGEKFDKIKEAGLNAVFLHVRSNADANYKSDYFPYSKSLTGEQGKDPGFDPLTIAIEEAHERGLELHTWINPYRVSASTDDIETLSKNNPAYIWLHDDNPDNDSCVIPYKNGIYFNPSSSEVQKLIISGVEEILKNYSVDGIHFDDYFYPSSDSDFDLGSYASYCRKAIYPLNQSDWRRANIDTLVSAVYRLVKSYKKVFGISPAAPISSNGTDRNYVEYSANVAKWMKAKGYVDYLAPQLYYGYKHKLEYTRFDKLIEKWASMPKHSELKLYIGLPAYKIGLNNDADLNEWQTDTDILAHQYSDCTKSNVDGIIIYNYSSFFADEELSIKQRVNLLEQMNGD